jgi:hypothetical protein
MPGEEQGATVTTHVRRNGATPHRNNKWQLVTLADDQLEPAMEKDDQGAVNGAGGDIEGSEHSAFSYPRMIATNRS